ncbi:hypothetical protein BKA64DRAFT_588925 [Cadophora sp. MPI-SDFR-AT-0126]|nr:hypothetical protein BKA64DRAFT_588925 [Leotiomycetes sp. MPI-SDFR-AT-0126]
MFPSTLDIEIQSTETIFPSIPLTNPTATPLSILDNTSANFARCAAIWYYPPPPSPTNLTRSHLTTSLSQTLNAYRPWCGRLSYTPTSNLTNYGPQSTRYQRIHVTYNTPKDIGVPLTLATCPHSLETFLPSLATRQTKEKAWNGSQLPSSTLLPSTKLSISASDPDAPNLVIQLTTFSCGSFAIGISITHCLSDAISLSQFANDWARTSRSLLSNPQSPPPELNPVFDPQRLDAYAAGSIDSPPDLSIQAKARDLPAHRYDWYTSVSNQPWPSPKPSDFDATLKKLDVELDLSPSIPIPWEQWDTQASVSHRLLHFSKEEILSIYENAIASSNPQSRGDEEGKGKEVGRQGKISKHDALLAHLWSLIISARQLPANTTSYLDLTFGVRARLSHPLPDSFLGSPICHVAIPLPSPSPSNSSKKKEVEGEEASVLATRIREYLGKFGGKEISWILHDRASEIAPQRLWGACLGREHVLLTTWVRAGVYDVVFCDGDEGKPLWVEAVMPPLDGLVEIMEAPPSPSINNTRKNGSWIDDGVDVTVFLEAEAMNMFLADERLWGGR